MKPPSTATTIRLQDDEIVIVDGPFADTKEQLAGYYFLDCENLDEAIEWIVIVRKRVDGVISFPHRAVITNS